MSSLFLPFHLPLTPVIKLYININMNANCVCFGFFSAMSSYLFIVKSELPLVIQAFFGKQENTGWVWKQFSNLESHKSVSFLFRNTLIFFFTLFFWLSRREWFLNGNYLIIIVSVLIIFPLALMKHLGMFFILLHIFFSFFAIISITTHPPLLASCLHYPFVCLVFISCID